MNVNTGKSNQRRALLNFAAAIAGSLLCAYVLSKWLALPMVLKSGATGWTLLIAAIALGLAAIIYLLLAWLLKFRYKSDVPMQNLKRLRVLHYGEQEGGNLVLVWYAAGLWITGER